MLRTQLRVKRALAERAERGETLPELMPPLYVLGWMRTGTTHLLGLLAEDPAHRALPYYESFDPVPPPPGRPDRRAAKVDKMLASVGMLSRHYQSIHAMRGDDPEECVALFMNALRTYQFDVQYRVPGYVAHLDATDPRPAHAFYEQQLRLIQHSRPAGERWLFKDPTHLMHLGVLMEQFPAARFVFTHRDPVEAIGSLCSLYAHTRAMFSDDVDPLAIGPEIMAGYWPSALEDALALAEAHPERRFAHVHYAELVRAPLATVEKLYLDLGLDLGDEVHDRMRAYVEAHPQAKTRVHRYSLEQFGLREEAVRERFADYVARYGVEVSPAVSRATG